MECSLYNFDQSGYLNDFINQYSINQHNYLLRNIYINIKNFEYNYIVCKEGEIILGIMPFVLYKNSLGNIIHSMPFIGYGGIYSIEDKKQNIFKYIIEFLEKFSKENRVKLITICTPPFREEEYTLYKNILKPDFEKKNFYQYLDLKKDIFRNIKSKFRGNLKRNVKKCNKYGVQLVENNSLEYLKYWYDNIYVKRLTETNCAIYPFSVFETIVTCLNKDRFKMIYAMLNEKIIGAGLYLNQGISFDNFMRVIDSEYFYTQAGTCMDYYSINYAINAGVSYYNWQSCDEVGSSIYKYKEDWGSELNYHYYLTKIVGDISDFKKIPISTIKKEYNGIYVMPYECFSNK